MSCSVIIFSRDRAMQLDALLDSMWTNMMLHPIDAKPTIIYAFSDERFHDGYRECAITHQGWCEFVREEDFKRDFTDALPSSGYLLPLVDDDIVHGKVNVSHAAYELDKDERLLGFSLRLGLNCERCYPHDCAQPLPLFAYSEPPILTWAWPGTSLDWSYPFSLDGTVMRIDDVRALLETAEYDNPNSLEDALAQRASWRSSHRPRMAAYHRSVVTGIPMNRVNDSHLNRAGTSDWLSPEALNDRYLQGERIDWRSMAWHGVDAAHCELPVLFTSVADREAA